MIQCKIVIQKGSSSFSSPSQVFKRFHINESFRFLYYLIFGACCLSTLYLLYPKKIPCLSLLTFVIWLFVIFGSERREWRDSSNVWEEGNFNFSFGSDGDEIPTQIFFNECLTLKIFNISFALLSFYYCWCYKYFFFRFLKSVDVLCFLSFIYGNHSNLRGKFFPCNCWGFSIFLSLSFYVQIQQLFHPCLKFHPSFRSTIFFFRFRVPHTKHEKNQNTADDMWDYGQIIESY